MKPPTPRRDGKSVAAKSKLREGEHSIHRVQSSIEGDKKVLRWSIRPFGYAQPIKKRTQVSKRATDGELRARALATAEKILRDESRGVVWTPSSEIAAYITEVIVPLIKASGRLTEGTRGKYLLSLRHLLGDCSDTSHTHRQSIRKLDIRNATRYRVLLDCLQEIARYHGEESARQARTVMSGYVLQQLQHDELIESNVIRGARIDLATGAKKRDGGKKGGVALSKADYFKAIDFLLEFDAHTKIQKPKRGVWTLEDVLAKWVNAIDLTLIQAATGLRISEVRKAKRDLFIESAEGLYIDVTPEISKGGIARKAYFLEPRIADRIRERLNNIADPKAYVVGSPYNSLKEWDSRNATRAVRELYLEMFQELDIAAFEHERSHIWRATLNTLLIDVVPEVMRAAQFGHTAEVNRKSYTDKALTPEMVAASQSFMR